jgi:hypothetical protein
MQPSGSIYHTDGIYNCNLTFVSCVLPEEGKGIWPKHVGVTSIIKLVQ